MIIKITNENANRRLDKFLFAYLNNAPHSFVYKMLRKKRIKLNGKRAEGNELLQAGDELRFFLSEETLAGCRKARIFATAKPLTGIIFEDENLLVVDKPVGLPSQGGMKSGDHLLARVLFYLQETGAISPTADFTPALCNRLDVNTSGLVVCGKNLHALQKMNALFAGREVKKEYLAIVHGIAGKVGESKTLTDFYRKDEKTNTAYVLPHSSSPQGGAEIITEFTVLDVSEKYSLLSVSPVTGRSHQIRVHLAHIGFPLIGDKKYGGKQTRTAPAQLLHCFKITLPCGTSWEAPPPKAFVFQRGKLECKQ
ncbi:MAG: RluA family pseudouridine synthase [Defluviitaleaceae bacterium]|nr:RluA family pseudouridine synthase [Defluviitaleaceae bacterium]MCL2263203.1 RluA family pseudouridine synthase [Defluviitaleaceae bacterium]